MTLHQFGSVNLKNYVFQRENILYKPAGFFYQNKLVRGSD